MKVIHIISNLTTGGAETSLFRLIRALPRDAHPQIVISLTPGGDYAERLHDLGVDVVELDAAPRLSSLPRLRPIADVLRREAPDVIQGWMYHGNALASLLGRYACAGAKVCWNVRQTSASLSDDKLLTRGLILSGTPLSSLCSKIIYNSQTAALQHEGYGYPKAKRVIIHNGIDCDEFRPDPQSRARLVGLLGLPADADIIGRFGRFAVMKDHRTLLQAFGRLAARDSRRHLLIVGPGISEENSDLMGWIGESGAGDRVHLLGSRKDLPSLMPGVDVNVSSSRSSEGFPNVIAEGMACGVPSVVSDVGESRLIVGDPARVVSPENPIALAAAIEAVLGLPAADRAAMGARDRARIAATFSVGAMVDAYQAAWA